MRHQGRAFEVLVCRLEGILAAAYHSSSEKVRRVSQYHVIGKDSGQRREVDVALFIPAGQRTLFVAIECRDRKGHQGLQWIEQLAKKRQDIRADRMVAASRDGFTKYAIEAAARHGIELHVLSERAESSGKLGTVELATLQRSFRLTSLSLSYWPMLASPLNEAPSLNTEEIRDLLHDFTSERWADEANGKRVSLRDIIMDNVDWPQAFEGVDPEGGLQPRHLELEFEPFSSPYRLLRGFPDNGWVVLGSVKMDMDLVCRPLQLKPKRIVDYRHSDGRPMMEMHEYDGAIWGLDGRTVFFAPIAGRSQEDPGSAGVLG